MSILCYCFTIIAGELGLCLLLFSSNYGFSCCVHFPFGVLCFVFQNLSNVNPVVLFNCYVLLKQLIGAIDELYRRSPICFSFGS